MQKSVLYNIINFILLIPFVLVLGTVLIVSKDLPNGLVSGKYFWFFLSMLLVSVSTFISVFLNRKKISFTILDLLLTIFCLSGIIITYTHNETITNLSIILLLILFLYFYFKIFFVQYRWNIFILILFFVSTGLVETIWGFKQLYGFSPSQHYLFKTTGSFFNPGPYAGYLAMVLPLAFYYILSDYRIFSKKFQYSYIPFYVRWGLFTISLLSILSILPATMSRASWIAAIVGCSVAGILYLLKIKRLKIYIRRFKKKLMFFLLPVFVLFIVGLFCIYHLKKDSADGRSLIWKISLQVIKEHPFGVGLGNFPGSYGEKQAEYFSIQQNSEQEQFVAGSPEYAFNEYLQICIEFGIIPFLIFVIIIVYSIYIGFRNKRYGIIASLISLLVFTSMSYPFNLLPFLISLAFLIALCSTGNQSITFSYTSKSFRTTVILILVLFCVTNFFLYERYSLYDAYKKWNKFTMLCNANLHKQAIEKYNSLYSYLDHEIKFLFAYAQSLSKIGEYQESNRVLEKAMKISCDPMLYNIMGKNYQTLGNYVLAEQYFNISAAMVPNRLYPYYLLAKLYDEIGDKEKACQMAEIIYTKEPKVDSVAVNEMRDEMKSICEKYKPQ